MICPSCLGIGSIAIINAEHPMITCPRCHGTGEVPDIQAEWIPIGRKLRAYRVNGGRYLSIFTLAERSGVSCLEISDCEQGMKDPQGHPLYEEMVKRENPHD